MKLRKSKKVDSISILPNELNEILDRLERIDHKEYICGFEFADSSFFNEVARCFDERKKLSEYITNLQADKEEGEE